eukprot:12537262-Alexandrium_andersonii.AAC.1
MPCVNLACAQWQLQPRYGEAVFAAANSYNDAASDGCEASSESEEDRALSSNLQLVSGVEFLTSPAQISAPTRHASEQSVSSPE